MWGSQGGSDLSSYPRHGHALPQMQMSSYVHGSSARTPPSSRAHGGFSNSRGRSSSADTVGRGIPGAGPISGPYHHIGAGGGGVSLAHAHTSANGRPVPGSLLLNLNSAATAGHHSQLSPPPLPRPTPRSRSRSDYEDTFYQAEKALLQPPTPPPPSPQASVPQSPGRLDIQARSASSPGPSSSTGGGGGGGMGDPNSVAIANPRDQRGELHRNQLELGLAPPQMQTGRSSVGAGAGGGGVSRRIYSSQDHHQLPPSLAAMAAAPQDPRDGRLSRDREPYDPRSRVVEPHIHMERTHGHMHLQRPDISVHPQIAVLEQERERILQEAARMDRAKKSYTDSLRKALEARESFQPQSHEYQETQGAISRLMHEMNSKVGTPEQVMRREEGMAIRISEIEEKLSSLKSNRFHGHLSSPESSQVSGSHGTHWSSPPTSDTYSEQYLVDSLPHHQLMVPSQNESGFCDNDSDITGSSQRKQLHSPNSTGVGTYSSEASHSSIKPMLDIPTVLQPNFPFPRSASVEDTSDPHDPANILAKVNGRRSIHKPLSLSQDTYDPHFSGGSRSQPFITLSQAGNSYLDNLCKPGSPASSSDTGSMTSSMLNRLGSGPALSEVSFSTSSSSRSIRLPRPAFHSTGHAPMYSHKHHGYSAGPEVSMTPSDSHFQSRSQYSMTTSSYDSDHEDAMSSPAILSMMPSSLAKKQSGSEQLHVSQLHSKMNRSPRDSSDVQRRRKESSRRRQPEHPRIPEEGSQRDSFTSKMDMMLSLISMVSMSKDHSDTDTARLLLALSQSSETCNEIHQSACMNMLIQILHNVEQKGSREHRDVRAKAAAAMRNVVQAMGDTRQGKYELCILNLLEKIRSHTDKLFEFIHEYLTGSRRVESSDLEAMQLACNNLIHPLRKLYKHSNDKEHYRPAILSLGGLQATAEILVVNHHLISKQKSSRIPVDKLVAHSAKIITVVISILINLTYGDISNKTSLCNFTDFLKSLMFHLKQHNEAIIASASQVLRNLSWRATEDIKDALFKCDASVVLMSVIRKANEEPSIQHITSALWNLSAHSLENRRKICQTTHGLRTLVDFLSYNSPSGTTAVVENVGGILKNLSVVVMQEEGYRKKFREAGGLAKLVQHLKSKNKTVLSNATGILWNLSARCPDDQCLLWDLGCIPLLDVLQTSQHKNVAECSRGALRNLLAFGHQTMQWNSRSDITPYNAKTQRGLSKSLYAFENTTGLKSQRSNDSLHTRKVHTTKSNSSLSSDNKYNFTDCNDDDIYLQKEKSSRLQFARVSSAPPNKGEWSSYVPNSTYGCGQQQNESRKSEEAKQRKPHRTSGSSSAKPPQGRIPYSFSESETFHLSCNSELHSSVSAASTSLSPHFPNEVVGSEPVSISLSAHALPTDLGPTHHTGMGNDEYADLEIEVEENDNELENCHYNFAPSSSTSEHSRPCCHDDIDHPDLDFPSGSSGGAGDHYPHHIRENSGGSWRGKGGTSNLALDGTDSKLGHGGVVVVVGGVSCASQRSNRCQQQEEEDEQNSTDV